MLRSTNILIHDERPGTPEFLLEVVVNRGYKADFAKDGNEIVATLSGHDIMALISNDHYETNGSHRELNPDQQTQLKSSSVFILGIKASHKWNQDMDLKADLSLPRPLLLSELWRALEHPF
jgi:CheY-like chemotaxis protein